MAIVAAVLVTLDEDRVVARDEKSGGRVAQEVQVEIGGRALEVVLNDRLGRCARQSRRRVARPDQTALEDPIELAVGADEERRAEKRRAIAGRKAIVDSVLVGIRATGRKSWCRGDGGGGAGHGAVARDRRRRGASHEQTDQHGDHRKPPWDERVCHRGRHRIIGPTFPQEARP